MLVLQSFACTILTMVGDKVVVGRTMEWRTHWDWRLEYIPANTKYTVSAPASTELPNKTLTSKYSVLGFSIKDDHLKMIFGGQNNQGLNVSVNYMDNTDKYQSVNKNDKYYVSIAELAHMLLSQYKDTASVKLALQKYKVWGTLN